MILYAKREMQQEPYRKKIIIRIGETRVQLLYCNKHVLN